MSNKSLFKYISEDIIEKICPDVGEPTVRYTPISMFNDPFEGVNFFNALLGEYRVPKMSEEAKKSIVSDVNEILAKLSAPPCNTSLCDERSISIRIMKGEQHLSQSEFTKTFLDKIGVLCLSSRNDSICMWAHYASNHKGIVVELDINHETFINIKNEEGLMQGFNKIKYSSKFPVIEYPSNKNIDEVGMREIISKLLLVKYKEWMYENEYRQIVSLSSLKNNSGIAGVYEINQKAIKAIYVGSDVSKCNLYRIVYFCERFKIPLYTSHMSSVEYKIEFKLCNY